MQRYSALGLAIMAALSLSLPAQAQTANDQSVEELRNTLVSVMEALVQKGVLTREQAQQIVANAQAKTEAAAKEKAAQEATEKDAVRVTYVPQVVRDQISKQVSEELKPEVTKEVVAQARTERWGVPGALPEWVNNFKFSGDIRFRAENDHFAPDNSPNTYLNYLAVNDKGGTQKAGTAAYLNTTEDRTRERLRLRLGIDAKITDGVTAGIRLATGSLTDPVSTNQTLGQNGNRYQFAVDQAYLRYDAGAQSKVPWMSLWLGRMPNPWISTDLVWDPDLQFEGIAGTWRYGFGDTAAPSQVFMTAGTFQLQEIELSSRDKWLYGGQVGVILPWGTGGKATLAGAYYYYSNIAGRRNDPGLTEFNYTAPQFIQKGNTVFDILNDTDPSTNLYGLAADYHELNVTAAVDIPVFNHLLTVTADYVANLGYDQKEVLRRSGFVSLDDVPNDQGQRLAFDKMAKGYQVEFAFGSPVTDKRGSWRTAVGYKYLERDAVLDAFTDSDFHLGGTNAKGYSLRGEWWFLDRTWLSLRYISTDEIRHSMVLSNNEVATDSPRFGVDVFLFDVNGKF